MYSIMSRIGEYSANPLGFVCFLSGLLLAAVVFFLLVVPFHNYIKYLVIIRCGDVEMASSQFFTFSPLTNFSTVGFFSTIVLGLGYGRPVYFDMHNFRRPGIHTCVVSVTGLLVYFVSYIISVIAYLILEVSAVFSITNQYQLPQNEEWYVYAYYVFFVMMAYLRRYCIFSFLFNLIPFGPLDMADVLYMFLPVNWSDALRNNQTFTSFLLFLFAFLTIGKPSGLLSGYASDINSVFSGMFRLLFGLG